MAALNNLFFLATVPPEDIQEKVKTIKLIFKNRFGSGHALNSPAHLTLIPPFLWPINKKKALIQSLDQFSRNESSFNVELKNFGAFVPRVIYIDVEAKNNLTDLRDRLEKYMDDKWNILKLLRGNKSFNPHMTVAFRDLTKENFRKAWPEFKDKDFGAAFHVDKIVLLMHQQKQWEIYHQSFFGKN